MAKLSMFLLLVVGALFQSSMAQTNHTVGDSTGWRIPSGGAATYSTWASQQTFVVGDVLVFNFPAGTHDVAEVTKAAFDGCTTSPISTPTNSSTPSPATVLLNLNSAGEHYYVCTFSGHCAAGQKLSVSVSTATSPPTPTINAPPTPTINAPPTPTINAPPTPTINAPPTPNINAPPTPNISAPPTPSSATSLSAMALPVVILSIVVTFFH